MFRITFIFIFSIYCYYSNGQRLTMSDLEIAEKKCEIVTEYFEFKKYVRVVTDRTEIPRIRNSNEIALYRLLSPNFTTSSMDGGNRESFIKSLRTKSNTFGLLSRTYETFDCPNFDFLHKTNPSPNDIKDEVSNMNIIDPGSKVLTTRYRGSLYFVQKDISSFDVNSTFITDATKGIKGENLIKELKYEMYKLTEDNYVLKIREIKNLDDGKVAMKVPKSKKDNTLVTKFMKPDPEKFEPCCDQPKPPDSDKDGYNDLIDCAPQDPSINPGAKEIIADGVDQNCDGEDQLGDDADGDGYTIDACKSKDPEVRKKCDCNDDDADIYYRSQNTPKGKWYNPYNGWNDDNCDCIVDEPPVFNWTDLKTSDYLIVGKGHLKRGHPNSTIRNSIAVLYGTSFLASSGYAIYSKLQSNKFYNNHKSAETLRISDANYNRANKHHKHFLISTGLAVAIFGTQYAHLKINNNRQKAYYRNVFENEKLRGPDSDTDCILSFKPAIGDNYLGYGLFVNLN